MISAGTRLGPYEIVSRIGAGGMGEVWRARDTRLEREVAVKILPAEFASNAQLKLRFEREAQTISSLNHPNICTLFDVGQTVVEGAVGSEEVHYLVMEHIEGETLADRLERGPLPIDEVIRRGREIADALDRAHRHGIVHRDLKPGNIMITRSGAKLLDFGLSRRDEAHGTFPAPEEATAHKPLTQEGTILGTWHYMAPEQLDGSHADTRSDIFAFGCVLYEMATARRAFEGKSRSSLIAAIVSSQPEPISRFQPLSPPALEQIVRKCLEKDPEERWQSVRDLAAALQWLVDAGSQVGVAKAVVGARRRSRRLASIVAISGWIFAIAAGSWLVASRLEDVKPFRTEIVVPSAFSMARLLQGNVAVSPGGDRIVFPAAKAGNRRLALRDLNSGETRQLDGTTDASFPFWSPDGRSIAFFADGKLKKIDAAGGAVQIVAEAHAGRGGSWGSAGWIVFAPDIAGPLMKVSENGGTPEAVTVAADQVTHRNPHFLADGRRFLFSERLTGADPLARVMIGSLDGGTPTAIVDRASNAQIANGYLLFVRDGNLVAQRFHAKEKKVDGALLPLAESVDYFNPRDLANFSVSSSGVLVYRQRTPEMNELVWFSRDGRELEQVGEAGPLESARLSRDGRTVVVVRRDAAATTRDVWLLSLDRRQMTRATFLSSGGLISAIPSNDGERLAISTYVGSRATKATLWIQQAVGSKPEQTFLEGHAFILSDWSSDHRYLIGSTQQTGRGLDVVWASLDEPSTIHPYAATNFNDYAGPLSPDGRWLSWTSDESGANEVYVGDFPTGKRKWQVSTSGGVGPAWSSDGRELLFLSGDSIVAVRVEVKGETLTFSSPAKLPIAAGNLTLVGASGDRLLLLRSLRSEPQPLRVIQNWEETIAR